MRSSLNVLVVEDESLIAMDIEMMLEDSGHRVVAEAASVRALEAYGAETPVDLAFVDLHLAEGSSGLEAQKHIAKCWPDAIVVFVTANPKKLPDDLAGGHGVISKPFSSAGFKAAIRYIEEGILDPPPSFACPSSLTAGPAMEKRW